MLTKLNYKNRFAFNWGGLGNSLKARLVAGFLLCALLTGLSGGAGFWSLMQIQQNMHTTNSEIGGSINTQTKTTNHLMALRSIVTNILNTKEIETLESEQMNIEQALKNVSNNDQMGTLNTIIKLFERKKQAIITYNALQTMSKANKTALETTSKHALNIADKAESDSVIQIAEGTKRVKENSVKITEINQSSTDIIKKALSVLSNCNLMNVQIKNILLADDDAVVGYSEKTLATVTSTIQEDIASLPSSDLTANMLKTLGEIQKQLPVLINDKKTALKTGFSTNALEKSTKAIEAALKQMGDQSLEVVDTAEFDAILAVEEAQAELDNTYAKMTEQNTSALAIIKTALSLTRDFNLLNSYTKDVFLCMAPEMLDSTASEVIGLLDVLKENLALLPKDEETTSLAKELATLDQLTSQMLKKKKELLIANAEMDRTTSKIREEMRQIDTDMVSAAAGMKSNTDNRLNTNTRLINRWQTIQLTLVATAFIIALLIGLFVSGSIASPLRNAVGMLKDIAKGEGDLTARLTSKSKDEIGELAKWFNLFIENIQSIIKDITLKSDVIDAASSELLEISRSVHTGTEQTSEKSNGVAGASEKMTSNMGAVATTTEAASSNMSIVANAAEQMKVNIAEIAERTGKARIITVDAVQKSKSASEKVDELSESAVRIETVTGAIADISSQINLLALNATIESARAGEAGKGFAVVASEIKELAKQTADATQEINSVISGIQGSTESTIQEIRSISTVIDEISDIVSSIAASMEEQSETTNEIVNTVSRTSDGIQEINANVTHSLDASGLIAKEIADVNTSAVAMLEDSQKITIDAQSLSDLALELKNMVKQFKV